MNNAAGLKAQGQEGYGKLCVHRHTSRFTIAVANACEKAMETRVRQAGRRAVREALSEES
jgi:hypothetical protein